MNLIELKHALRQLRLGGIATVLETRLHQAQAEAMAPIDLIACLVNDELSRRADRLLERRRKLAAFRDPHKTLDQFDFNFNPTDFIPAPGVKIDELADAVVDGSRKEFMETLTTVPLLIIDDFGMRKLPLTAAEDLLEIVMRRYERASTLLTSNRPVEDWGKLLGDVAAVTAMLDRILHHGHILKCGPRSWRTKSTAAAGESK